MRTITVLLLLALGSAASAATVSTTLTYQGSLEESGVPANGVYDFTFQLMFPQGGQASAPIVVDDVTVVGGVFTVPLNFGVGFTGGERTLAVSVRPGNSTGSFTALVPDVPLTAAPNALFANFADRAASAVSANDVASGAIDETDLATAAVSTRALADDSVTVAKLHGATYVSPNSLSDSNIPANTCDTFDIAVTGGFEPGDWVVLDATTTLPANVIVTPMQVVSTNVVKVRFCNIGSSATSFSNQGIRMMSFR